jgi:hypothetical protein
VFESSLRAHLDRPQGAARYAASITSDLLVVPPASRARRAMRAKVDENRTDGICLEYAAEIVG